MDTDKKYQWYPMGASHYTDQRMALKKTGLVRYNVRCYRGVIRRRTEDDKVEHDYCPHAHNKMGAAKKCAEREAKRRNRELKRGQS